MRDPDDRLVRPFDLLSIRAPEASLRLLRVASRVPPRDPRDVCTPVRPEAVVLPRVTEALEREDFGLDLWTDAFSRDDEAVTLDLEDLLRDCEALARDEEVLLREGEALARDEGTLPLDGVALLRDCEALARDELALLRDAAAFPREVVVRFRVRAFEADFLGADRRLSTREVRDDPDRPLPDRDRWANA